MQRAPVLSFVLLLGAAPVLRAEGLVQVTVEGAITRPGGARVEIELAAHRIGDDSPREVALDLHLAQNTSAADVLHLLVRRLEAAELDVVSSPMLRAEKAHVFVARALSVSLRLGSGLSATVTTCEQAPAVIRIDPPTLDPRECTLAVSASTFQRHARVRSLRSIEVPLEAELHAAQVSERLFQYAIRSDWVSERPGTVGWRLLKMTDGAEVIGVSLALRTKGDWRIEVGLP